MLRLIFLILIALALAGWAGPEAWAQDGPVCTPGEDCAAAEGYGAWAMIAFGLLFFAIWLMPPRANSEKGRGFMDSLPMMGALQRRIDRELTGWRRFQWPVLGVFFVGLGVANLLGWY